MGVLLPYADQQGNRHHGGIVKTMAPESIFAQGFAVVAANHQIEIFAGGKKVSNESVEILKAFSLSKQAESTVPVAGLFLPGRVRKGKRMMGFTEINKQEIRRTGVFLDPFGGPFHLFEGTLNRPKKSELFKGLGQIPSRIRIRVEPVHRAASQRTVPLACEALDDVGSGEQVVGFALRFRILQAPKLLARELGASASPRRFSRIAIRKRGAIEGRGQFACEERHVGRKGIGRLRPGFMPGPQAFQKGNLGSAKYVVSKRIQCEQNLISLRRHDQMPGAVDFLSSGTKVKPYQHLSGGKPNWAFPRSLA